ncbi:MAG: hypothetical protein KF747_18050 [Nitrospira sp.]|nr:hypothetical protein [Nitrospira sp.]
MRRPRTRITHYVDRHELVSPPRDPALTLHRSMLVNSLFKYAGDIRRLADGYALRFLCSQHQDEREELIGTIADYIIFESRNAPQLMFEVVEEPQERAFWLQVRGIRPDPHEGTSPSILPDSALPYFA